MALPPLDALLSCHWDRISQPQPQRPAPRASRLATSRVRAQLNRPWMAKKGPYWVPIGGPDCGPFDTLDPRIHNEVTKIPETEMLDGQLANPFSAAMLLLVGLSTIAACFLSWRSPGLNWSRKNSDLAGWAALCGGLLLAPLAIVNRMEMGPIVWLFGAEGNDTGLIEYGTVAALATVLIASLSAARRHAGFQRWVFVLTGVCTLIVLGEEVSWGQWIVQWRSPEFFQENNLQSETNLHNFLPPRAFEVIYSAAGVIIFGLAIIFRFKPTLAGLGGLWPDFPVIVSLSTSPVAVPLFCLAATFMQHHMFQELSELVLFSAVAYGLVWGGGVVRVEKVHQPNT